MLNKFKLKMLLTGMILFYWVIAIMEHYGYNKQLSVWDGTILISLLIIHQNIKVKP